MWLEIFQNIIGEYKRVVVLAVFLLCAKIEREEREENNYLTKLKFFVIFFFIYLIIC